ncbi:MAG: MerR family transcriptional regulator [Pseudomonadota bacterium]
MTTDQAQQAAQDLYRIGTVAQLTGIAVERLRAWERRYGLAPSQKSGKTRFYSTEQVHWLQSVKALIDQGQPIGSLINLSQTQLDSRLGQRAAEPANVTALCVDLIGTGLLLLEQQHQQSAALAVSGRATSIDQWFERREGPGPELQPGAVIVQVATIDLPVLLQLQDTLEETPLLVCYEFATPEQASALRDEGFHALRWPASWSTLEQTISELAGRPLRPRERLARRFDDETLIALAGSAGTGDPVSTHLARLINELNGLAEYADVVQREAVRDSRRPPLAAPLHERVAIDLSQARALLEGSLETVIGEQQQPVSSKAT